MCLARIEEADGTGCNLIAGAETQGAEGAYTAVALINFLETNFSVAMWYGYRHTFHALSYSFDSLDELLTVTRPSRVRSDVCFARHHTLVSKCSRFNAC